MALAIKTKTQWQFGSVHDNGDFQTCFRTNLKQVKVQVTPSY